MRILLLENDRNFCTMISNKLKAKRHTIDSFFDWKEAYESVDNGYMCFILEANNNFEVLKKIRDFDREVPVVILGQNASLETIQNAYGLGCTDFIKKPFFVEELVIKIQRLFNIRNDSLKIGTDCEINFEVGLLRFRNVDKFLSHKERLLLSLLVCEAGKVVNLDRIKNHVWDGNFASSDSVRALIKRLRKKIPYKCLETVKDVGYMFKYH